MDKSLLGELVEVQGNGPVFYGIVVEEFLDTVTLLVSGTSPAWERRLVPKAGLTRMGSMQKVAEWAVRDALRERWKKAAADAMCPFCKCNFGDYEGGYSRCVYCGESSCLSECDCEKARREYRRLTCPGS
jgi:hypothetical protein